MRSLVNNSAMPPVAGVYVSIRGRYSIEGAVEGTCTPRIPQRKV